MLIVVFLSDVCFFTIGVEPEPELNTANDDEQLNLVDQGKHNPIFLSDPIFSSITSLISIISVPMLLVNK